MSLKKKELGSNFSLNEDSKKEVSKPCCSHEPLENKSIFQHFDWIGRVTPCFHVNGNQIKILHHPKEFYEALNNLAKRSRKRIVLASLYLGTSKLEQELVDCIYDSAKASKENGSNLQISVLLDYMRGSRGERNSRRMLLPLLRDFSDSVTIALYHTPDLRGWIKALLPERYNETIGLFHMKVYVFDDTVIMSGANLSESYFTDRQDRYAVVTDCKPLADFFEQLITTISTFSFHLHSDKNLSLSDGLKCHPFIGSNNGSYYRSEMKKRIESLLLPNLQTSRENLWSTNSCLSGDTRIYPLVQMGPFGITLDELVTKALFEKAASNVCIYLASGYFNLTDHYMDSIINICKARFEILTAAPQANSFFGAKGVSGAIPDAYTCIAKQFHSKVTSSMQDDRIKMYEYVRSGWTVHAKGLWYYMGNNQFPVMTMIGSPNFGYRSVCRDLECQLVIVTQNRHLQEQLHQEQIHLYKESTDVTNETFDRPERAIPRWVKYLTPIIRNFF